MKLKILICDDVEQHRNWMKAALVNAPITANEKKRIDLADEAFEIHEFEIVGEAIKALENGLTVDLGLADADFCNLPPEYIIDKGFDVSIEKTSLRGFDLLEAMKKHLPETPAFLFTGYASNKRDIYNEILTRKLSLGTDWFFIPQDKGYGIQNLTEDMPFPLKKTAEKLCKGMSPMNKNSLRGLLNSLTSAPASTLLDCSPEIKKRKIRVGNLLMGWAKAVVKDNGNLELVYDRATSVFEELINLKETDEFKPLGIWQGGIKGKKTQKNFDYMVTAKGDYQQHPKYQEWKEDIDKKSAQLVLEVIENHTDIMRGKVFYPSIKITGYNCKNEDEQITIDDEAFRTKFFNALIVRRFAIGLTAIRDSRKNTFDDDLILATIAGVLGRKTKDDEDDEIGDRKVMNNLKQFYNEVLGLSVQITTGENNMSQKLDYTVPKIMNEESDWLKKYIPQIEERQDKREWRSFMD